MPWYSKYLTFFEKSFDTVPASVIQEIRENMKNFKSPAPLASVVVIAHNEEKRLLSCLWSLSENICNFPIEIIGIDNNSSDKTSGIFEAAGIKWYPEKKKGPGHARSCGLAHAKGKFYFSMDGDTIYPPLYLQTMLHELQKPGMAAVCGSYSFAPEEGYSAFKLKIYELFRDIHSRALSYRSPEWIARGATLAYVTALGRNVGYRVNIRAGEDGALILGLKKYGKIKFILNRKARAITGATPLREEGTLWENFLKKLKKEIRHIKRYVATQEVYEDQESNLILKADRKTVSRS